MYTKGSQQKLTHGLARRHTTVVPALDRKAEVRPRPVWSTEGVLR